MTTSRIRDKHLSCSICFELYTSPKTLPCLHSFCEGCLENHIMAKKTEKSFGCPMCNTVINIPNPSAPSHQWSSQFITDFKLQGMLEDILNIEAERRIVTDITNLGVVIESLRENEQVLFDKIEEDKQAMAKIERDEEDISQQITDVFATIRLKLNRKEDALKQRLNQVTVQRKDTTSRSWLHKQKLVDQTNTLVGEAEYILASGSKDKRKDVQRFHDSHSQFKLSFGNLSNVQLPHLELDMCQVDVIQLDSLKFCTLCLESKDQYAVVVVEPQAKRTPPPPPPPPPPPVPTQMPVSSSRKGPAPSPPVTSDRRQSEPSAAIRAPPQSQPAPVPNPKPKSIPQKPTLIAVLTPVKADADKEPEFQDVLVVRQSNVQMVVAADFVNKKIVVIYVQQGSKTQKSIKLDANPARLCKLDASRIAVSMNNPYKVVILNVYPDLKMSSVIKTNINNVGITALNPTTIAVSAKNKVNVMTTAGVIIKEFNIKVESSYHAMSWYVTTTPTGSIIVADKNGEMVSCLTPTGQTLWQWKTPDSSAPSGVACDAQGRIHVVIGAKKEVHRLSETGQHLGIVLSQESGLDQPSGMDIDQFGQWYILKRSRQIQIFKY